MNKIIAALVLFTAVIGALADYPAPPPPPPKPYHAPPPPPYHAPPHHAPAPLHPVVHTYPVKAPAAKCGANLLVGCAPSVAHVPCVPVHPHPPPPAHY
ncbi:AAEL017403-PA [Aedes aegypti]|uniref:Vitelline membrane protein 15a-2 n=2 Tax=Aedes aegypti TaxID=7159 RepID=V15A2_AEDAE|nr:vitelline membrane protein 15a-2 [Aedes aegypti]P19425.2 RecName: Full=Vitelline membrane protein 15a-2; Contains: RecName: Full=Trypsin-modulating oostatic factor; Short=TMOF; AltName: Full=OOSH; Flags: Precursor [Aedes aegypti]AAB51283.1 vitelline membrane protein homolog [Aedes aegypti]EJY58008.1 AAEL017403-PA [Aedes aegypti]